ncbi:MAG TPA: hypothetical protein DCR93_37505, partial [Cytophagales bacterium]|nr:hypothetical protein [Cytophagales bacterium]
NCSVSLSLDVTAFDCDDVGTQTVTLTATDASGNTATTTAMVTVVDNLAPTVITKDVNLFLDESGNATLTTAQVDDGTFDNCGVTTLSLDKTDFTVSDLGEQTVTLTATDASGNSASTTATVTVNEFNYEPVFTSSPVTAAVEEVAYNYVVTVSDQNTNETLTLGSTLLPGWLTLTDNGDGTG